MTRRLIIRDMRAQQPTLPDPPPHRSWSRLPAGIVGGLVLVAFFVAWVVAMLALGTGCSSPPPPPPCVPTRPAAIVAECRAQYRQAGCAEDPDRLCPELVRACDARIDALSDQEVCTP